MTDSTQSPEDELFDEAAASAATASADSADASSAEDAHRQNSDDDTSREIFRALDDTPKQAATVTPRDLKLIQEIPVTLSVELGATRLSIRELLELTKGSIVELDGLAGEPMNILVNSYLVAHGEVVVVEDRYGVRITDIVDKAERIGKLNR